MTDPAQKKYWMKSADEIKRCDYISLTEIRAKFHTVNFYIKNYHESKRITIKRLSQAFALLNKMTSSITCTRQTDIKSKAQDDYQSKQSNLEPHDTDAR